MTALAMGRNCTATPEQQKALVDQFARCWCARTRARSTQYRDQRSISSRWRDPAATDVIVKTEVVRAGQSPVQIDYGMEKKDGT